MRLRTRVPISELTQYLLAWTFNAHVMTSKSKRFSTFAVEVWVGSSAEESAWQTSLDVWWVMGRVCNFLLTIDLTLWNLHREIVILYSSSDETMLNTLPTPTCYFRVYACGFIACLTELLHIIQESKSCFVVIPNAVHTFHRLVFRTSSVALQRALDRYRITVKHFEAILPASGCRVVWKPLSGSTPRSEFFYHRLPDH